MRGFRFREAREVIAKRLVTTKDELNADIEDWQTVGTIQAEIWPLQGNQSRGEMGVTEESTHKLFTLGTVESNTRVVDGGAVYLVGYVQDWTSHREAILQRLEDDDDGG